MSRRNAAAVGAGVLALLVLGSVAFRPLVRWWVEQRAQAAGFALRSFELELDFNAVTLRNVSLELVGVPAVRANLDSATVWLDGLSPRQVSVGTLRVVAEGPPMDVAGAVAGWLRARKGGSAVELIAQDVSLSVPGVLSLDHARISSLAGGGTLHGGRAVAFGMPIGRPILSWVAAEGRFSVGIGRETPAHSPLRVDVSEGHAGSTLRAELRGVSVTDLTFGKLRDDRALIDATLDLPPEGEGRFSGVVRGLTLPAQAASAMGSSIAVTAHVLPARDAWHLRQVAVVAGVVRLGGEGVIALRQDHAALSVKLAGSVPCSALAGSALSANLGGGLIGGLIGGLARVAVTGDVAVSLQIEADSRNPGGASVKRTVGVGCGVGL